MKKVLFDENVPRLLRRDLAEFEIRTVQEEGWSSLTNGVLYGKLRNASRSSSQRTNDSSINKTSAR